MHDSGPVKLLHPSQGGSDFPFMEHVRANGPVGQVLDALTQLGQLATQVIHVSDGADGPADHHQLDGRELVQHLSQPRRWPVLPDLLA